MRRGQSGEEAGARTQVLRLERLRHLPGTEATWACWVAGDQDCGSNEVRGWTVWGLTGCG